ncbi:MAG: response regulator [Candidatus Scalindua sp.]
MSKTVMIVEDEHTFHELYEKMLEDTNYELIRAYDGSEALSKLHEVKPDIIILDMLMDMMTGDTFFLLLKSMPEFADIPVIIISSLPESEFKNLRKLDPNLIYIDKMDVTRQRLFNELRKVCCLDKQHEVCGIS